jgi:pilus assembly protein CpaE
LASLVPGETLRVLLISARDGARDEVGEALAGRVGDHRLYWVSQADLAPSRAEDLLPHVILVDDDQGGANPITLISQLRARLPAAAVLVLVSADALQLARQAVLAGARAFLTRPLDQEELVAAIRQVVSRGQSTGQGAPSEPARIGRVVVFCAPKGGTGRTTLALNTAVSLQTSNKTSVALVDADYAAPALDVALNLDPSRNIADLLPKMSRLDTELVSSVLATHASGLRVLLAPPPADLKHPISLPQVQQALVWLKRMFDWVVVDLGLPLDETAFAFLDGADRIVMSVLPEMVGLRNTRLMLDQLYNRGYPEEKVWLVLNRSNMTGGVSLADIEARLRVHVSHRIPDDQSLATHSINRGVPLVTSHRSSALARAIRKFAQELAEEVSAPESEANGARGRLFRRPRPARA